MRTSAAELGLGCSAFGAGARQGLDEAQAFATVALAADAGVTLADTSAQFPRSEDMLGRVLPGNPGFRVVVKTRPAGGPDAADAVEQGARASLGRLGLDRAHALMVPAAELEGQDGLAVWRRVHRMKDAGLFATVGVAACVCDAPLALARRFRPDLMQLPASLLDQRLVADGSLEAIAELGVGLHLRSVFLRGLLFRAGHELPPSARAMAPELSRLRRVLAEAGADPLQAALHYALARPEAQAVIVGVASPGEFRAVLAAAAAPAPALDWSAPDLSVLAPCAAAQVCRAA